MHSVGGPGFGYRPNASGKPWHAANRGGNIPGATIGSREDVTPLNRDWALRLPSASSRHRRRAAEPTTWQVMCGNGAWIFGIRRTPMTLMQAAFCVAGPGSVMQSSAVPRFATSFLPSSVTTSSVFVRRELCRLTACDFTAFGFTAFPFYQRGEARAAQK